MESPSRHTRGTHARRHTRGTHGAVCVETFECLFLRTPSRAPYRTPSACAKRRPTRTPPTRFREQPLMHWLQGDLLHKRIQHWSIPATGYRCYRTRSRRVCAPRSALLWRSGSTEADSLQTSSKIHSKSEKRDSSGLTETDAHMKMWCFRPMQ